MDRRVFASAWFLELIVFEALSCLSVSHCYGKSVANFLVVLEKLLVSFFPSCRQTVLRGPLGFEVVSLLVLPKLLLETFVSLKLLSDCHGYCATHVAVFRTFCVVVPCCPLSSILVYSCFIVKVV